MKLDPKYNTPPDDSLFIHCKKTPLKEAEATYYLREAWKELYGDYPSLESLGILWAQSALETGRWKQLRNYNWGNVKKRKNVHYTSYFCSEYINGEHYYFYPYHPQTLFSAHESALEGAKFHLNFLATRSNYKRAWQELVNGNVRKYVFELKQGGYFTAPLQSYTAVVVGLYNEFMKKSDLLLEFEPPEQPAEDPYESPPDIDEPEHDVTDLIPEEKDPKKDPNEEKMNLIVKIFMTIWTFIIGLFAAKKD